MEGDWILQLAPTQIFDFRSISYFPKILFLKLNNGFHAKFQVPFYLWQIEYVLKLCGRLWLLFRFSKVFIYFIYIYIYIIYTHTYVYIYIYIYILISVVPGAWSKHCGENF